MVNGRISQAKRISSQDLIRLLHEADTAYLLGEADARRTALHGRTTFFVHSLNLNPSNICGNRCELCAFWREPAHSDAYCMSLAQAEERLAAAQDMRLTDLHVVGGLHPDLAVSFYEQLFALSRRLVPSALIQGITAVEIRHLADKEGLPVELVLRRLKDAGLGAISGGGAEIFDKEIRARICRNKISADEWLAVHEQAHRLGIPTNATMLFGHIETVEHIADHLLRLRDLQDRTGGFLAFIPLPFHPSGTRLPVKYGPGGHAIARIAAAARLFLDNIPHIRVLGNYVDKKLLHILMHGGVDDIGGTSLNERIARAAGAPDDKAFASIAEMASMIEGQALTPALVNSRYDRMPMPSGIELAKRTGSLSPDVHNLDNLLAKIRSGARLCLDEAILLHDSAPVHALGELANQRRFEQVPNRAVTFVVDRNINTTNVCEAQCRFCAFHVGPDSKHAFALSVEEVARQISESAKAGATQVLFQGGLNPALGLSYYEQLLVAVKRIPNVWVHSLSPTEIAFLARQEGITIEETLRRLIAAGLDSLPGGGAEILHDAVRERVSPKKIRTDEWLGVMRTAHHLGLKTTATMVYGLGEITEQRLSHLFRIRDLQDETGGFTAFIPWSFQSNHTKLSMSPQTGVDYLRIIALARLVLDNVPHIQAGWVTEGPDLAQLALSFGADDFGGVLMEEKVVAATGVNYGITRDRVVSLIHEMGLDAVQRSTLYEPLRRYERAMG